MNIIKNNLILIIILLILIKIVYSIKNIEKNKKILDSLKSDNDFNLKNYFEKNNFTKLNDNFDININLQKKIQNNDRRNKKNNKIKLNKNVKKVLNNSDILSNGFKNNNKNQKNSRKILNRGHRQKSNKNSLRLLTAVNSAFPPLFNIAPRALVHVNATCGQNGREEYCKLIDAYPHKSWSKQCGVCNAQSSDLTKHHSIENIFDNINLMDNWWQSSSLREGRQYEYVTITLDLRQVYQVFFLMLKAAISPRPASWILEKSLDNITYEPWQYFGLSDTDCLRRYNTAGVNGKYIFTHDKEVICTTQFSKALPLENGEIYVSLTKNRPGANEQSPELMEFIKARYIRIRFQGMHSTANSDNVVDWLLDSESLEMRSFYSLKQIRISGRLDCHGHAERTVGIFSDDNDEESMLQCACTHNTCGKDCSECCSGFRQRPFKDGTFRDKNACVKCECHGHTDFCQYSDELKSGICKHCNNHTAGNNCELCQSGYFRLPETNLEDGCKKCECNAIGTIGGCDPNSGLCNCKEGFEGAMCEFCSAGYYGEYCLQCSCDVRGTVAGGECENECHCKAYVEGTSCNQCKLGYFGLKSNNLEGCTKCYCSGVGLTCNSVDLNETSYETRDSWKVTDLSKTIFSYPSIDNDTGQLVFGMYDLPNVESVYWLAPEGYLGKKLTSYGSKFYAHLSWVIIRGDTSGRPTSGPDIILMGQNGMKIAYGDDAYNSSSALINIDMTERHWYHVPNSVKDIVSNRLKRTDYCGGSVTRNQFMSVIVNLEAILVRGTFHTDQAESILDRVIIYGGGNSENEESQSLVENCVCPPGYDGLSCEDCHFGFIKIYENSSDFGKIGKCLQCPCNGHAESCDLDLDICGDCQHHTYGERCERCKVGYYGNPLMGTPDDCKRCGCPLLEESNNFSPNCQLSGNNQEYVCTQCPEGYTGDHCEVCDDGFYGDPKTIGSGCERCLCNGGPCDIVTGECIECQGNTDGWRCERCKLGYWGDPAQGCEPCNCYDQGSSTEYCDTETGQCLCKPQFTGQKCDKCDYGYADIDLMCQPCECNLNGSLDGICNQTTSQCLCKKGVDGIKCDQCEDKYFGLSEDGCDECLCNPIGSASNVCDRRTGQCLCHLNVIGRKCEKCQAGYFNLTGGLGCRDCQCDRIGSINDDCDQWTGQCECKNGVGGRKCEYCMEGFYGFSNDGCKLCESCQSPGHICDSVTGRCVCPPNSKGPDCHQCLSGTFGWQPKTGCTKCDCDNGGSIGQSCNFITGQCVCREGYVGRRCDACAIGYFGYPDCRRCNCNIDGSFIRSDGLIECDANGQCPCKELVIGLKCDTCVHSTFGLDRQNPEGCTKCFCFGRSQKCQQSELSWGHIRIPTARNLSVHYIHQASIPTKEYDYIVVVQMEGSNIHREDSKISIMNGLNLIPSSIGNVTIGAYTTFYYPLYFQLPPQFYGDKINSYGGFLRYQVETDGYSNQLDTQILYNFPLAQIHSHNKLILDYYDTEIRDLSFNESYAIPLHESYWKFHHNRQDITRAVLMTALQNIKHIFLRATSWSDFSNAIISNVHMDSAIYLSGATNVIAHGVEECDCPNQYNGISCQDPGKGFYRFYNSTEIIETVSVYWEDYIGYSVRCNCNSRSEYCDQETGACMYCRNNTGGPNCDRCAEGFFGDPNYGNCEACPCPETSKNFAKGCTVWNNEVSCICKPGYMGTRCEMCRPGYFGNPSNTNGSCEKCKCNADGSLSNICDEVTGQCHCKLDVLGRYCDKCLAERHVLETGACKICDNCSLILMDYIDSIGNKLRRGVAHMDFTGIPAPYLKLEEYDFLVNKNFERFRDFMHTKQAIENFDDNLVEKLFSYSENNKIQFRKLNSTANKINMGSNNLYLDSNQIYLGIVKAKDGILKIIFDLNAYRTSDNQIAFPIALEEARNYLNEINYHYDLSNDMRNMWDCAWQQLYFYGNASDTVFDQKAHLLMIWKSMNITNHKISNMDRITSNTFDLLNEAEDILEHVINTEILVREIYSNGKEMEKHIIDLLDQQFSAKTGVFLDMMDNNFSQIKTGILNLINLGKFWNDGFIENEPLRRDLKKHWIPKAWRHANRLTQKSKDYAKMFQPTKDGARVAMLASSAHKNISDAIEAARVASIESKQSVLTALEKLYPQNGRSVVIKAQESIEKSNLLQQNASGQMENLNDLKYNLKIHEDKIDAIKSKIWQAGIKSNNVSVVLSSLSTDNAMKMVRDSSHLASKISDEMRAESRKAVDIKSDIYKLRQKYSTLEPDWDIKLGLAKENISHTLSNIRLVNTSLNTAEIYSEKEHQKFELWNNTISKQLQELKDKIAKARHAAEGVKISLESLTPKCIRSYMPEMLGLSTSNTIKLSLALRHRQGNSPLIFLEGHDRKYIGLEMFRNKIRFSWNLGGSSSVLTHPLEIHNKDPKYDEAWYHIEANRTLNVGTLVVRKMTANGGLTSSNTITGYSDLQHTRFYRTNFNRVYIGGVPHNLKPKELQASPGLNVVINQIQVDNKPLGIWNFIHTEGNCKGAMIGALPAAASTNTRYFNGFGYSQVQKKRQRPYRKNIFDLQMTFKTMDENALLFLAVDDGNNRTIAVSLNAGKIVFRIDYGDHLNLEIKTENKYNTGKWVTIAAAREFSSKRGTENGRLKINSEIPILGTAQGSIRSGSIPDLSNGIFYLGGVPPGFNRNFVKAPGGDNSYHGCMKDIAINSETYDPLESSSYSGVEETCKESVTMSGFNGNGYIELPSQSLRKRSNVAFVFRTLQHDCLLLLSAYPPNVQSKEIQGNYSISILDGKIHVLINTGKSSVTLVSNNSVNDGEYHVINVIKTGRKIELYVDDEFQSSKTFIIVPSLVNMPKDEGGLYVGGAPEYPEFKNLAPSLIGLKGAIRDLVFNNRTISLSEAISFVNADVGRFGPSMGTVNSDDIFMKTEPMEKFEEQLKEGCDKVSTYSFEYNAYKFGDNQISYSEIQLPNRNFWQRNFLISFDIRTFYPNGILLISPGSKEKPKHYVSLILKDGHLTLIIRSRKREELTLTAKLNDGEWHHVSVYSSDRKVTMSVEIGGTDQKTSVQMKLPKKIGTSHNIYVGGLVTENSINLPSELLIRLEGLKGCIRNLQINNKTQDLTKENKHFNVGKCFPKIEKGSYFPGNAFAIYRKNFQVGKFLELEMDFRTSELNGILISVSEPAGFPALSLELHEGNIIFSCDLGDGNPIRVESILPSKFFICDNKWHNISALYDFEQIVLRVDNHSPAIAFAQHRIAGKVQTKSPLYIGGLPDIAPSGTLLSRDNFKGCIRNISIRNERRDWIDMDRLHNILLSECLAV